VRQGAGRGFAATSRRRKAVGKGRRRVGLSSAPSCRDTRLGLAVNEDWVILRPASAQKSNRWTGAGEKCLESI